MVALDGLVALVLLLHDDLVDTTLAGLSHQTDINYLGGEEGKF